MVSEKGPQITVHDAEEADVTALTSIKGEGSEAVHRDRLRDAREASLRYLVVRAAKQFADDGVSDYYEAGELARQ